MRSSERGFGSGRNSIDGAVSATRPAQLTENLSALELVARLDQKVVERIEEIVGNKPEPLPRY